jgi:threonine aldolase
MIDLRSDTVTQPTQEMRRLISEAEVGDDVFGDDPTVNNLQHMMADMTGKEEALFVPSGTMSNQVCIKTHTQPGNEIIVESNSHLYNYESGAPALLSGVQVMPLPGKNGHFNLEQIQQVIRPMNVHHPQTRLICIENTHNRAGGTIFPIEEIKKISRFAGNQKIKMHLDGARLWNASIATKIPISEYCKYFDSASLCFSKGLGAPVGSILVGTKEFINKARYYRKVFGGGMRQAGLLAAAAIYAVNNNFQRLEEDHCRAKILGEFLSSVPKINFDFSTVQTNIVIFDVKNLGLTGQQVVDALASKGIKLLTFAQTKIRAVIHLHITDKDIQYTIQVLKTVLCD